MRFGRTKGCTKYQAFSLAVNNLLYNYINPVMYGRFKIKMEYR
jgi:hypothetical protein